MRTYRVINGFGGVEDTVNACIKSGGIIPDFKKIGWCVTKKEYPHVSKADYDKIYAACKKHIPSKNKIVQCVKNHPLVKKSGDKPTPDCVGCGEGSDHSGKGNKNTVPSSTKSGLSMMTILIGVGVAGAAGFVFLKSRKG